MLRPLLSVFAVCLVALPAQAAEKRVWRVDSVVATRAGNNVVVQVKGAVKSGGWSRPRLKLSRGDGHTLVVEFLAQPPAADAVVITALMPVTAKARLRAGRGIVTVKAVAEANDVTAQILH
jgi:hypothetical protein